MSLWFFYFLIGLFLKVLAELKTIYFCGDCLCGL